MRAITLFLTLAGVLTAEQLVSRHVLRSDGFLTEASGEQASAIAGRFVRSLGLDPAALDAIYLVNEYRTAHNGVTHLLYRQRFDGIDVHNSDYTVNVDSDGHVINAGGSLFRAPAAGVRTPAHESGPAAVRAAMLEVQPAKATSYLPLSRATAKGGYVRFSRGGLGDEVSGRPVWHGIGGEVRPAWVFEIAAANGIDRRKTIVDAETGKVYGNANLTRYQVPPIAKGLVFERSSPQPNPTPGKFLEARPPYVQRTLQLFTGDPIASPKGWVDTNQTVGNNTITGQNPVGRVQLTNPEPTTAPNRDFSFPLELGPGAPTPTAFKDAANTNLFYWTNKAHDLFHAIGFDEAAGNFQRDNFGRGGVDGDAMLAYSHFGIAASAEAALNNAFFTTFLASEDGSRASINMFLAGSRDDLIFSDGSYDNEVIVHEYTHGVSNRLIRQVYDTWQGQAMGEAWSDFFGLEFTLPEGAPADGIYAVGGYMSQDFVTGVRTRPYSTQMEWNPLTFANYGRITAFGPEEHDDGEIWMQALWEVRAALISQLGEAEGRKRARLLVLDGMKLSPPAPSMVDARDAILLADRVDFRGASQDQLWAAFAKRGFGVLAQSNDGDSIHVSASFEKPSNKGQLKFYDDSYTMGETIRFVLHDANNKAQSQVVQVATSSGDVENVVMRRRGEVFLGSIESFTDGGLQKFDNALDMVPADFVSLYYLDAETGAGAQQLTTQVASTPAYTMTLSVLERPTSGAERALFTYPAGSRWLLNSASVTLPFDFPYFGKTYRRVWVAGDGTITFDIPPHAGCNTRNGLASINGIAPMWMELAYGGTAQRSENVFFSTGNGTATFRWAGETLQTGEAVNFSAVLYADGRITFHYGAGNNNLVNSGTFGCTTNAPTVGISNGRETFTQISDFHHGSPFLEDADTLLIEPPFGGTTFPHGILESPKPNDVVKGVVTIRGTVYDDRATVTRLDILIDGIPRRLILPNQLRADFCGQRNVPGCPRVGFLTSIDLSAFNVLPGKHTIQIRATNSRGGISHFPPAPVEITVEAGQSRQPTGAIEAPMNGATVSRNLPIRGYAYAPDLRVVSVDVIIDGVTYGQAQYGVRRDDICNALAVRPPNCPAIGFTFTLDTVAGDVQLPNGRHSLQVRARDEAGRFTLIPETPLTITVENELNQSPTGELTTPKANDRVSGTLRITGHAYDPDGQIAFVTLLVDGISFGSLRYGLPRPETCAGLKNVAACPNIGFEGEFDTRRLLNGLHQLGVLLTDETGRSVVVPRAGWSGINIFVEN